MKSENTFILDIPWAQSLEMVNWIINCRNRNIENAESIKESLNSSIIIHCCIIIEGIIFTSLKDHVADAQRRLPESTDDKDLYNRIWNDYISRIESAQFSRYLELITIVTGKSIKDNMKKEEFEAMKIMFQFRNQLAHGNEIAFDVEHNGKDLINVISNSKYQSIYEYGKKKNLIQHSIAPTYIKLLTDRFANHFYNVTKKMIAILINNIDSRINTYLYEKCKEILKEEKND